MSLDTYTNLKKSIIDWSKRGDLDLLVDDFINLTEVDMFKTGNAHEGLDIREEETTSTASTSTNYLALPDGYKSFRSVRLVLDSGNGALRYKAPDALPRRSGTGQPCYFTVGSQIEFDVTPDQIYTVEVNYYKKPTALSLANPSNIVLANHPDIYLNGALYFLFNYAQDTEQANRHLNLYAAAIDGANEEDKQGRYGPAPYARIEGSTP